MATNLLMKNSFVKMEDALKMCPSEAQIGQFLESIIWVKGLEEQVLGGKNIAHGKLFDFASLEKLLIDYRYKNFKDTSKKVDKISKIEKNM